MIRTVFAIVVIALGLSAAIAQEDPMKARKALMKANGDQAKIGAAMAKGEAPFDAAAVHKMFAQFQDAAAKMPALFPDNTKAGDPTDEFNAAPKIWEDMADFKAKFVKFGEDAKAADAKVTDAESLKAALGDIGKNDCGACHKDYRLKKS
jgi:cytochrome c556